MRNIDDYCNPDTVEMADFSERDLVDNFTREARKEVRKECKERFSDYKFNLPRIKRGWNI